MKPFIFISICILAISCSSTKNLPKDFSGQPIKLSAKNMELNHRVFIITDSGNMLFRLYDSTPLHRDNFAAKVQAGFYDSLLFHRVIKNFMIQGGDPESKHAIAGSLLGNGEAVGSKIPAEIFPNILHKKGVLAMARDGNPEKASSNCQFYIVQGKTYTGTELEAFATRRNFTLDSTQKQLYTTIGGTPHLDKNYTVFGEIEMGIYVIDKIASVKTGPNDRPMGDVRMRMYLLDKKGKILLSKK